MFTAFWIYWLQWTLMGGTLLYRRPESVVTLPVYIPSPDSDAFIIRWGFFNPSLLTIVNVYSALLSLLTSDRQVYWLQWTLLFTELITQNATDYSECWSDAGAKISTATCRHCQKIRLSMYPSRFRLLHNVTGWDTSFTDYSERLISPGLSLEFSPFPLTAPGLSDDFLNLFAHYSECSADYSECLPQLTCKIYSARRNNVMKLTKTRVVT